MGGNKRTRKFLKKKTNLSSKVKERKKRQKVKRIREERKESRNEERRQKKDDEPIETKNTSMGEAVTTNGDDGKKEGGGASNIKNMGLGEFLSGGFLQSSEEEEEDDVAAYGPVEGSNEGSSDSSEDEDESEEKGDVVDKKKNDEVSAHKRELEELKKRDPEFYKYLKESDSGLLSFGEGDDEEASEDEEEEEAAASNGSHGEDDASDDEDDSSSDRAVLLTKSLLKSMTVAVFEKHSLRALPKLIQAFRSACHLGSNSGDGTHASDSRSARVAKARPYRFKVKNSAVFNDLMIAAIGGMADAFRRHLQWHDATNDESEGNDDGRKSSGTTKKGHTALPTSKPRWEKLRPVVVSFCGNLLHFLSQLMDREMQLFVLQKLRPYMPFVASLPTLHRKTIKILLKHFAGTSSQADDEDTSGRDATTASDVRLAAFLRLRQLVLLAPPKSLIVDTCLKGIYLTHVRNSKFINESTLPIVTMRRNCVVELFLLDPSASYQQIFVYIRQLAITLRLALCNPSKDSARTVYNWQFMESCRTWCQLLCAAACSPSPTRRTTLRPLVYPLIQIIRGAATLQATATYVPMRLHCAELLNDITAAADVYVPTVPMLLAVLSSASFRGGKPPRKSKAAGGGMVKPPELDVSIRLQKKTIESGVVRDQVVLRTLAVLADFFELHRYSIAFPELLFPAAVQLRQYLKTCKTPLWRQAVRQILRDAEGWAQLVKTRRRGVDFGPADFERASAFMQVEKRSARKNRLVNPLLGRAQRRLEKSGGGTSVRAPATAAKQQRSTRQKGKQTKAATVDDDDTTEERVRRHSLLLVTSENASSDSEGDENAPDEVGGVDISSSSEEEEEEE
eukprot:g1532.t1